MRSQRSPSCPDATDRGASVECCGDSRRSLARILNHRSCGPASGAPGGTLTDFAINDEFMKQLAESIRPGDATLFLLMKEMTADKGVEQIKDYGGGVLKTSLADTREQMLRNALTDAVASDAGVPAADSNPDRGARVSRHQGGVAALVGVSAALLRIPSSILSII